MRTNPLLKLTALAAPALLAASLTTSAAAPASARGVVPPANDSLANAQLLADGDSLDGTTSGATRESTDPESLEGTHTVWYSFRSDGRPARVATDSGTGDPAKAAHFVVYTGTAGDLTEVAEGDQLEPGIPDGKLEATFPTRKSEDYYVGVANDHAGAPFTLTLDRAKRPASLTLLGADYLGQGQGQYYVRRGHHPRIAVRVVTGFAGHRKPGRGPVTLETGRGGTFKVRLHRGRAEFVLPRIRHSYQIDVTYPGSARIDAVSQGAYVNLTEGPPPRHRS